MANIGDTAAELMDKIKIIMKGLPFFMKPGLKIYNVMTMRFDNGCRIMAKTTTKTSSIGYTVHILYMDEFAHINANFIDSFFRSRISASLTNVIVKEAEILDHDDSLVNPSKKEGNPLGDDGEDCTLDIDDDIFEM